MAAGKGLAVAAGVQDAVRVAVGEGGTRVGVRVRDGVREGVTVRVHEGVREGVTVRVGDGVREGVSVRVGVAVGEGVTVHVGVLEGVGDAVGRTLALPGDGARL